MKKKIRNLVAMLAMVAAILSSGTMTAYAYVDETEQTASEPVIAEEVPEETEITPFSVSGNGQLLDDVTDDETKQFLTIQTKNGNTYECDLAEFIEEVEPEPVEEKPAVIVEEPRPEPVQEEIQPESENGGMGMGAKPKREEEEAESEDLEFYD